MSSASAFDRQARELSLDGMSNGGAGSTGHATLDSLQAAARGQGIPIRGESHHFQIERQSSGQRMVTALDPDAGQFDWNVTCPSGWEYLHFAYDGMIDACGTGDTVTCVQQSENRLRTYLLDTERGRLGDLIEDRAWS